MNIVLHLLLGVFLLSCGGKKEKTVVQHAFSTSKPSHMVWDTILNRYVDGDGNVNYAGLKEDSTQLDAYLDHLGQHPPSQTWSKEDSLAYFINLYNAATVKLIVDHYPVQSIKDIPNRWGKKWIQVGNNILSLDRIEHDILRKMDEPRIHFAINCASYSCPKLWNQAFIPEKMEQQLDQVAHDFVNDPTKNRFENNEAKLSEIFKWYKRDFTKGTSLLEYINQFLKNPIDADADIDYLDYDWSLNDAK
ncbi:DUF547 domain-containing protein [Flagellimonas iocasae]|uniref:DUF547 domain-containing protein n=1 Tax=Flagellimonas iocasae TaxID=2055905 RepID=A0ABW4XXK3_9FLAO